ncbi:MAG: hypothetical protein ACE14P_03950 [Methanotrichaceae archaeon]
MRYLILIFVIVLMMSLCPQVSAATIDNSTMQYYINIYNGKIDNAPDILKVLVGNQRIDLTITRNDGSVYKAGFVMQNAHISQTVEGGVADPTIVINATEDSINRIRSSSDPISQFQRERSFGGIDIQGKTYTTRAELGIVLSNTEVLKFFYNIFFG